MNNEEKILSILETLTKKIDNMDSDMQDMKTDMSEVKNRLTNVEDKVLLTNLIIENDIKPGISLLVEGHMGIVEKLWNVPEDVEDIKESVSILKFIQNEMAKSWNK